MDDLGGIHIDTKNNGFRTGGVEARWAEEPFVLFKKSDFFFYGGKNIGPKKKTRLEKFLGRTDV